MPCARSSIRSAASARTRPPSGCARCSSATSHPCDQRPAETVTGAPARRLRLLPWSTALIGVGIALLNWHVADGVPGPGLDASWQAAIHRAAHEHFSWGTQLIYTYGP